MAGGTRDWWGITALGTYTLAWAAFAIRPLDRFDWLLENLLVFLSVPILVFIHIRIKFSRPAIVSLFVFMLLHTIGSHWSYSNVPMAWDVLGTGRNNYDRVVHFSFGLLLWLPAREVVHRLTGMGRTASSLVAASLMLAASALYEILEWGAVAVVAPGLGTAFLGAQGDEFDAPKDMAMALLGTCLAIGAAWASAALASRRGARRPAVTTLRRHPTPARLAVSPPSLRAVPTSRRQPPP